MRHTGEGRVHPAYVSTWGFATLLKGTWGVLLFLHEQQAASTPGFLLLVHACELNCPTCCLSSVRHHSCNVDNPHPPRF